MADGGVPRVHRERRKEVFIHVIVSLVNLATVTCVMMFLLEISRLSRVTESDCFGKGLYTAEQCAEKDPPCRWKHHSTYNQYVCRLDWPDVLNMLAQLLYFVIGCTELMKMISVSILGCSGALLSKEQSKQPDDGGEAPVREEEGIDSTILMMLSWCDRSPLLWLILGLRKKIVRCQGKWVGNNEKAEAKLC